jgi:S1-C subfamily serine protease
MKRKWITTALVMLPSLSMLAGAQERERRPGRVEVGPRAFAFSFNRGRIGVVVQTDENATADKIGARIEAVSPGGPAEKAGLKADDIITRFNGVALAKTEEEGSPPGVKLVRLAQALDPGDTVRVEYRRGNDTRTATLVAAELDNDWGGSGDRPRVRSFTVEPPGFEWDDDDVTPRAFTMFMGPLAGLELVTLNADLGEYFGTTDGVLVVRVRGEDDLPLKAGDVIVTIGGRKPTSPASAMRILRSYDEGETVQIEVMRKQKRLTVTWTLPDREDRVRSRRRAPEGGRT